MFRHDLPRGTEFWAFLYSIDKELAERARDAGCSCGGRLHSANYPRKPRGCPDKLPEEYRVRLSYCCERDGCRKRETPPSVRFLGRKVYLGAIVVLLTAMSQGATSRRVRELSRLVGVDRTTVERWRVFWQERFPQTIFWCLARARLVPVFEMTAYPISIVEAFLNHFDDWHDWKNLLCFLSPISTTRGLAIKQSQGRDFPAEDALKQT